MNDSLYRDLGVLRGITERWSKFDNIMGAVYPLGINRLAATNIAHTMTVLPKPNFPIHHPLRIEDLYRVLGQPEVRKAGEHDVVFHHHLSDRMLEVKWPGGSESLKALDVQSPTLPQGAPYQRAGALSIPADALEFVARAMSMESTRFALCGVLIDGQKRKIVASDGKRLHFRRFSSEKKFPSVILAKEAVWPLMAAQEREGYAPLEKIGFPEKNPPENFSLSVGRFTLYTKPIDGQFPNYDAVIPESFHGQIRLDAAEWRDALKSFRSFFLHNRPKDKNSNSRRVRLDTMSKGAMRLVAMAEGKESARLVRMIGAGANVALFDGTSFNGDYLLDASWNEKETILQTNGPEKPLLVDGQAVVMPLAMGDGFDTAAKAHAKSLTGKPAKFQPDQNPDRTSTWKRRKAQPNKPWEETMEPKPQPIPVPKPRLKPIAKPVRPKPPVRMAAPKPVRVQKPAAAAPAPTPKAAPKKLREYNFPLFS